MKAACRPSARAFTLIELFIVIAVFTIIVVILWPDLTRPKRTGPRINCTNSLKQIGYAFRVWELDHNDRFPMQVSVTNGGTMELVADGAAFVHFQVMSNELGTPKLLKCPADKQRVWATNFTTDFSNQKVSYFVGLDATADSPASFLAGDRNITNASGIKGRILTLTTNIPVAWTEGFHEVQGNICLADGSVQGLSTHGLQAALVASGLATNRLAMP